MYYGCGGNICWGFLLYGLYTEKLASMIRPRKQDPGMIETTADV